MSDIREVGRQGENQALEYLRSRDWRLLEANYQTKWGEIDLIMQDGRTLVFVEVKRRQNLNYGDPEQAITPLKQRHLIRAALCYVKANRIVERLIRFDSVSVGPDGIRLMENAFEADG